VATWINVKSRRKKKGMKLILKIWLDKFVNTPIKNKNVK
jgi:hypothetical protein